MPAHLPGLSELRLFYVRESGRTVCDTARQTSKGWRITESPALAIGAGGVLLDGEFLLAGVHLSLETGHDGRVHLGDARFGQIQRCANFFHRHLFVII